MKIAIFSDIHGNKEALQAIINDIKNNDIDEIISLGDNIGIGPNPKECLDLIINNNINMVLGNHELYYLKGIEIDDEMGEGEKLHHNWVRNQITNDQKLFLEKCNLSIEKEINNKKILFEHFLINYNSKDDYPFQDLSIINNNSFNDIINSLDYNLIFIGHEHKEFNVDKLYDVGSSGCRKDNITRYTVLDTDTFKVETKLIEFDREAFINSLLKEDYPDRNKIAKWFYDVEV